jgi:phosphopantothenoylcysteine decarboxylase / phosphopantothenate---cysteine ligase
MPKTLKPSKSVLISAGPMRSPLDSVRFLQNRSSGKMGLALAKAAVSSGTRVGAILGPVDSDVESEFESICEVFRYETPQEYSALLEKYFPLANIFISAAAVLDFQIVQGTELNAKKMDRKDIFATGATQSEILLRVQAVPDFVQLYAERKQPNQTVVAFSLETGSLDAAMDRARQKMLKKKADAIFLNLVSPQSGPDSDTNRLWFLTPAGETIALPEGPKTTLGGQAWELVKKIR